MQSILVTYADNEPYLTNAMRMHQTALQYGGLDKIISWNREKFEATDFYRKNKAILDIPKGGGYWLWKPYIILDALENNPEDFIVYHDVGRDIPILNIQGNYFKYRIDPLVERCRKQDGIFPGFYIHDHGPNRHWTKRDCFILMGCDSEEYWDKPQILAGFNIWHGKKAKDFLEEWIKFCSDERCVGDANSILGADFMPFYGHRHDQSILTNLCIRHQIQAMGNPVASKVFPPRIDSVTGEILWGMKFNIRDINVWIKRCNVKPRLIPR
jgi:hypothetical protein